LANGKIATCRFENKVRGGGTHRRTAAGRTEDGGIEVAPRPPWRRPDADATASMRGLGPQRARALRSNRLHLRRRGPGSASATVRARSARCKRRRSAAAVTGIVQGPGRKSASDWVDARALVRMTHAARKEQRERQRIHEGTNTMGSKKRRTEDRPHVRLEVHESANDTDLQADTD